MARHGPTLPWSAIDAGFEWEGQRLCFATQARGIFRPKEMQGGALSILTSKPRKGRVQRYNDAPQKDGVFFYDFQGNDPDNHSNRLLRQVKELAAPLIYFLGVEPAVYQPIWPVYVQHIDRARRKFHLVVEDSRLIVGDDALPELADGRVIEIRRQYVTMLAKRRVHQARFRLAVLRAYGERCAVCHLPCPQLLEAAHIVPDKEEGGEPVVPNGLALCRLHHGLFDSDLMGIRSDGVIELSRSLLAIQGGPTLEHAIKPFQDARILLPKRRESWPSPERLQSRYLQFLNAGGGGS